MTYDEMNSFILNYIENDKTGRAIMLTGEWGSGKSYYVKNKLKSFLEDKDNGKYKCVIVSLYGLSDTSEISKAIYTELRSFKFKKKHEVLTTAGVAASVVPKTIFNAMTSRVGYDIGQVSDKQMQKVYDSINLNKKLLVLEDIERTQIDIIELLGYINNMCENDGVKVLLVTNERELLNYHMKETKKLEYGKEKTEYEKEYSESAKKYLKAKEKSVSDTLVFYADFQDTIGSIIDKLENDDLSSFKGALTAPKRSIMRNDITNYREVIVACQKACDIYNYMKSYSITADSEFKKCIFVGLLNYLQKHLDAPDLKYESGTLFSADLSGSEEYPLMRFCYNYYHFQTLSQEMIRKTIVEYKEYLRYVDRNGWSDKDLKIIYSPYEYLEKEIELAIKNIHSRLNNIDDISFLHYGRIINSLLVIKYDINLNNNMIVPIINKIKINLKEKGDRYNIGNHLFSSGFIISNQSGLEEFERIKTEVFNALNSPLVNSILPSTMNYEDTITKLFNENIGVYNPHDIIEKLQLDRIIQEIHNLHPRTIYRLRSILSELNYSRVNDELVDIIKQFKGQIDDILQKEDNNLDLIQKKQLQCTCKMIDEKTSITYI